MREWQRDYRRGMGLVRSPGAESRLAIRKMVRGPFAGRRAAPPQVNRTRLGWFVYYKDR